MSRLDRRRCHRLSSAVARLLPAACTLFATLFATLIATLFATDAAAHGRFPGAGMVVVDPSDEARIWVRTTYGFIATDDAGESWSWICPAAVGPQGPDPGYNATTEDPVVVLNADGSALAGIFDGMAFSSSGCDWLLDGESVGNRSVVDLRPEDDNGHTVALSANGVAANTFDVNLWESSDYGRSWSQLAGAPPRNFFARTLGVAETDPQRLYLAGRDGFTQLPDQLTLYEGVLFRSDDRAESWTRHPIPGPNDATLTTFPYLAAVHPSDPDTVFIQSVTNRDIDIISTQILLTRDAGESWAVAYERPHPVAGFALSPDGTQVAVGSDDDGLWVAPLDSLAFEKVSTIHVRCLTWHASGLFACADEFTDGFTLARSIDGGHSFEPLMNLGSPCGALACGADTTVGAQCPSRWVAERVELGAKECGAAPPPPSEEDASCSCRLGPRPKGAHPLWLIVAALVVSLRRLTRSRPAL